MNKTVRNMRRGLLWAFALVVAACTMSCNHSPEPEALVPTVISQPLAEGGATIEVTLERPGRLSAAVYTTDGHLVRELLRGQEVEAGPYSVTWDGRDQEGQLQVAGDYEVRFLLTPGFRAEYVTSLGIRPDTVPYDSWVGNHGGAAAVALDETGLYVSATVTETAPVLLKQSIEGRERFWTRGRGDVTRGRFQGGVALASNGNGRLYMLQQNGYLQVIDAESGRRRHTWDVMPPDYQRNREESNQTYRHGSDFVAGADLAARGDTLVLSQRERNLLTWLNPEDGAVIATVALPAPAGVTVAADGTVYAISGQQVLAVTREGEQRTVIDGLDTPVRLACSPADESLLVVEWGGRQQVRRFDPQGKLQATYGREGGRQQGTYKPKDFHGVTAIAATPDGGFVISEQAPAPRRVAHFDRDGALVDEWYGGQPYYAWGAPDPRQPTRAWFNPGSWLTLAEIDPIDHSWRVLENYYQPDLGGGLVGAVTGHRGRWRVVYHEGRRYLVSESSPQVLRHEDGSLQAVSIVSDDRDDLARAVQLAGHEGKAKAFRWLDRNGDGQPQGGEFEFSETGRVPSGNRGVADNFELLTVSSGRDDGRAYVRVHRTAPRWTEHGPVYPFGEEPGINEVAGDATIFSPAGTGGTRGVGAFRDRQGNYYVHYNTGIDWHGTTWPTYWGGRSRLLKWLPDGTEAWRVGRHAVHGGLGGQPHTTPPGFIHVGAAIIGEVRDTVVMADRVEWMGMVWTKDGLYVGNVLDGRIDDGLPDEVYYWWRTPAGNEAIVTSDNATGGAIMEDEDGNVWFFTQGRNSVPTYRIHGWDGWQRFRATVALSWPPLGDPLPAGTGLTGDYYLIREPSPAGLELNPSAPVTIPGEPVASQVDARIWHGSPRKRPGNNTVVDGFQYGPLTDWSRGIPPLGEEGKVGRRGTFAVRWTGYLEAPLSEDFTFSVYGRGGVRLWIAGEQRIFGWNESGERRETAPISLRAGRLYPVQLDFYSTHLHPACSLNWESTTFDRQRIPTRYLHPRPLGEVKKLPDLRAATETIRANTFDATNIESEDRRNYTYGLRHRGIGKPGAWLGYQRVDFGEGADRLFAQASGHPAGKGTHDVVLAFHLDSPDGPMIAELRLNDGVGVPAEGVPLTQPVTGVHDVYVVNATTGGWHFLRLPYFSFR